MYLNFYNLLKLVEIFEVGAYYLAQIHCPSFPEPIIPVFHYSNIPIAEQILT